jgi:hypothetical protein
MGGNRNAQRLEAQAASILRLKEEHPLCHGATIGMRLRASVTDIWLRCRGPVVPSSSTT